MAPEVLSRGDIDGKADVYSFSLVFWEVLTGKPLFPEYDDMETFTKCICTDGVRPHTEDINPVLLRILKSGWAPKSSERPSFEELVKLLENSLIEIYFEVCVCDIHLRKHHVPPPHPQLAFPTGAWFWQQYFNGQTRVPWQAFLAKLHSLFKRRHDVEEFILSILCEPKESEQFVSIERFRTLMLWFGDLQLNGVSSILDRINDVIKEAWFFGSEPAMGAEKHLKEQNENGLFLVRLNMGGSTPVDVSPFTISSLINSQVSHTRVVFESNRSQLKFQDIDGKTVTF